MGVEEPVDVVLEQSGDTMLEWKAPSSPGPPASPKIDPVTPQSPPKSPLASSDPAYLTAPPPALAPVQREHRNAVAYLGICFMVLFSAFMPCQGFVTTLHPGAGYTSLAILYCVLGLFSFVSPSLISRLKVPWSFVIAASCYVVFILVLIPSSSVPLLLASVLEGAAGSVLWVTEGTFVSIISKEAGGHAGYFTGLFLSFFQMSSVVGYLIVALLLQFGLTIIGVLWFMGLVGTIGVVMLFFVRRVAIDAVGTAPLPVKAKIAQTAAIFGDPKLRLLLFYFVCRGLNQSFKVGQFSAEIGHIDVKQVARVFLMYGVLTIATSFGWGKVMDAPRGGWKWLAVPHLVIMTALYLGMGFAFLYHSLPALYAIGVLYSISDSALDVIIHSSLVALFPNNSSVAYAAFTVVSSMFFAVGFTMSALFPAWVAAATGYLATVAGFAGYVYLHVRLLGGRGAAALNDVEPALHLSPATPIAEPSADADAAPAVLEMERIPAPDLSSPER